MLCSDQMLIIAFLLYKLLLVCWWLPTVESLWKLACFLLLVWFGANLIILFVWLCLVHAQGWLDWLNCSQEHLVSMVLCHIRGQDYHGVHYWSVSVLMQVPWTGYNYPPSRSTLLSLWPHLYIRIACVRLTLRMCKPSVWVCFKYNEEAVRSWTCMPTESYKWISC